jgi:hypothetical protein
MENRPENKKEAPGNPTQKDKMELPGQQPQSPKKEKENKKDKKEDDPGPIGKQQYGNPKNQSGKNTSPDSED